jgi:hypothetical protein
MGSSIDNHKHINQILEKFYKTSIQEIKSDNGELSGNVLKLLEK